jgi:hypothetical protein
MFRICSEFSAMFRIFSNVQNLLRIFSNVHNLFRIFSNVQNLFRIFSNVQNLFRIYSEFWVIFRIFRHFSEFLAQKLVYSESLDFVVMVTLVPVPASHFWNNLHLVCSKSKIGKQKRKKSVEASKAKWQNLLHVMRFMWRIKSEHYSRVCERITCCKI